MKKIKLKTLLRLLLTAIVVFTGLHFTVLKTLKVKSDRQTIYDMHGAEYSDATLKWKIRRISSKNINRYSDIIGVATASVCNDNIEILELIERKGGEFILQNLRIAYECNANNSIAFLESRGFSAHDNDMQVPKFLLRKAIDSGTYYEPPKKHLQNLLDRNEELKTNPVLISMVRAMEGNMEVFGDVTGKKAILRDELLSYFTLDDSAAPNP